MKKLLLTLLVIPLLLYGCGTTVNNSGGTTPSASVVFSGKVSQYDYSGVSAQSIKVSAVSTMNTTPLVGAAVKLEETLATTVTDGSGNFAFSEVPSGDFTLEVTKENYLPVRVTANSNNITKNIMTSEDYFQILNGGSWLFYNTSANENVTMNVTKDGNYYKWQYKATSCGNGWTNTQYITLWLEYDYQSTVFLRYQLCTNSLDDDISTSNPNTSAFINLPFLRYPLKVNDEETVTLNVGGTFTYKNSEYINSMIVNNITYNNVYKIDFYQTQDGDLYHVYYYYNKSNGLIKLKAYGYDLQFVTKL